MADDEAQVLLAAKKLPLYERIEHKNWKVRSEAYDDVRAGCERAFSSSEPILDEAGPLLSKCIGDANANAMDKALDALCAWLKKADESQASRIVSSVCSTIAVKCLKARPGTVAKATEACLLFIELEEQASVIESILKALSDKVPKVVAAALEILFRAVAEFGTTKVIDPKPLFKSLPAVFGHSNAGVRDKSKELTIELSSWVGPAVVQSVLIDKMNDTMKKDVATSLASIPSGKKKPLRFTRKEAAARAAAAEGNDGDDDGAIPMDVDDNTTINGSGGGVPHGGEDDEFGGDPYDFSDPVDILAPLQKTPIVVGDDSTPFWDCFESKKWNVRKGALEKIKELAKSNPRLSSGNSSSLNDLTRELKKILAKDANINCAASAADVAGALALGLRKDFTNQARQLCPAVLERFKEKNTIMSKAADDALRTMAVHCYGIGDVADDIAAALAHKNPKVRLDTLRLLRDMVDSTDKQQASRTKDSLIPAVVKLAPDADAAIRENAQAVLVAYALKLGSYNAIQSFLSKLDDSRTKMIEQAVMEAAKSAGPLGSAGGKKPSAPAPSLRPPTHATSTTVTGASSARSSPKALAPKNANANITASRPATSAAGSKPTTSRSRPAVSSSNTTAIEDDSSAITSGRLSIEEADQMLTDAVGAAVVEGLRSPQWQARLESTSTIAEHATSSASNPEAASILLCLAHLPGWGDKNFQVVNKCLEVAAVLAKECPGYGKLHAAVTVEGAGDKIHELKHRIPATDALNAACEAIGPRFVLAQLHSRATAHKNPKVLSESLAWMATVVEEFGLAAVDLCALLGWLIADLGSPNAPVRNQAMGVLGRCHAQVGGGLMSQLAESLKPAQVTALEEIFRKNPVDPEFQPTRKVRGKKRAGGAVVGAGANANAHIAAAAAEGEEEEDFDEPAASLEDLIPRASIASSLTSALIGQISSSNWKERNSALEEIENLIKSAGNRIQPDIPAADLFSALRGRMADTNRNLAARTLLLLGKLAEAIGQPFDKLASRPVLVPALSTLSDNKKQVRDAVIVMLDSWVTTCSTEKLIAPVADVISNAKVGADGRVAALTWMSKVMTSNLTSAPATTVKLCTESALRAAVVALGDKAAAVRDGGALLLNDTARAVDGDKMLGALSSLDSSLKKTAEPWVMKAVASAGTSSVAGGGGSRPASGKQHAAAGTTPAPSARPSTRSAATATASTAAAVVRPSTLSISEQDTPPLLSMSSAKASRSRSFRPRPGKFEAPPLDELETLDAAFTGIASDELRILLFSRDFKDHVKAADSLANVLVPDDLLPEGIACLDIIFRWAIVRICEGNTQVLVRVLEMLRSILDALLTTEYRLTEVEAAALLPGLIEKAGHNQDRVRGLHRDVLHGVCAIFSTSRVLDYLTAGLGSKNSRTKVEICDAMAAVVEKDGVPVLTASKSKPMLSIASTLKERDGTLRTAALGVIEEVWAQEGADTLWKLLGKIDGREKDMVDDRLKRSSRQAGASQPTVLNSSLATDNAVDEDHSHYQNQNLTPEMVTGGGSGGGYVNIKGHGTAAAGELAYSRPAFTPPNALDMTPPTALKTGVVTAMEIDGMTPYHPPHAANASALAFAGTQQQQQQSMTPVPRALPPTPTPQTFQSPHMMALNTKTASSPIPATGPDDLAFEQRWSEYLATMASPSLPTAVNATKQLCAEIMNVADPATMPPASRRIRVVMGSSAERLFNVVLAQLVQIFDEAAKEAEAGTAPSSRGCKFALNVMLQGMSVEEIAGGLPQGTLRRAISLLLCRLVDERGLLMFEEGTTLVRAVNVLIAKMLDSANRNYSFAALLQILREQPPGLPETAVPKFNDLVVKCLIKLTKGLQSNMDGVDMSALLLNIHDFFMFLGVDEIRRRSSQDDKPLRMVKTVLHELCKMAGHKIYIDAAGIPGRKSDPQPIIFAYIGLNLSSLEQSGLIAPATGEEQQLAEIEQQEKEMVAAKAAALQASLAGEDNYSSLPGGAQPYSTTTVYGGSTTSVGAVVQNDDAITKADVKARLKGIMTRLVQRDTAQQKVAMVELFYLRKESPEMVERLVFGKAGTSVMFREFIENGLAELEKNGVPASSVGNGHGASMSRVGSSVAASSAAAAPSSSLCSPAAPGSAKLSSLRERLSNIKSGDAASSGAGHSSTVEELTARMQMLRRGANTN